MSVTLPELRTYATDVAELLPRTCAILTCRAACSCGEVAEDLCNGENSQWPHLAARIAGLGFFNFLHLLK